MRPILFLVLSCLLVALANGQGKIDKPKLSNADLADRIREGYDPVDSPEPTVTAVEQQILEKAYALLENDTQHAYSFLQDTLDSGYPASAAFYLAIGNVYFRNGNHFQAETQYVTAVEKHPSFQRAWNALGLTRYRQGDYDGAATALANSVRYGANDALTYGLLGFCHLQKGRYRSAETAYHFAMLFDPLKTDWAEGIAQVYYETGRYEEAISVFDDLIRIEPENVDFWLLKANAWLALDEPLKTARCIEIARRVGEIDDDSYYLLGNIYLEQGVFNQAREVFHAAASRSGKLEEKELLQAIRYMVFNDQYAFAEEVFGLIQEEGEDWSEDDKKLYRFLTGEFAYFREDMESSESAYLSGLEIEPFNGYALLKVADIKTRQGDTDQALIYFDRAATDPSLRYDALVSKAMLLIDQKRYRFALRTIEEALAEKSEPRLTKLHDQVQRIVESQEALGTLSLAK